MKIMFLIIFLFSSFLLFPCQAESQVRCNQDNNKIKPTTAHLFDNNDGTVLDSKTGLIWKKCSEGQVWDITDNLCVGQPIKITWLDVFQRTKEVNFGVIEGAHENNDWRVPNIKELASIVEQSCFNPAVNLAFFPSTYPAKYWSSSPGLYWERSSWLINFMVGNVDIYDGERNNTYYVRLVRTLSE